VPGDIAGVVGPLPSVGALITDTGGISSHPAIIAREFRVPAVVATRVGTSQLHD
jgi:pyruvate,water dikinase